MPIRKQLPIFATVKKKNEGDICPLFLYFKMDKTLVKDLVQEALEENKSLFLIDLSFLPNNKIFIEVDGDTGVSLQEIIRISRNVEHNLDREEEDLVEFPKR